MNQTESPSAHALVGCFLIRFSAMLAAACAFFLLMSRFPIAGRVEITPPSFSGGSLSALRVTIVSQYPAMLLLILLFLSVFSVACPLISLALCIWRGCSLGCVIALLDDGLTGLSPTYISGLTAYFLASAAFALLAAFSVRYAALLVKACAADRTRLVFPLGRAYIRCFLSLSGVVLLCGVLACALI